jgi:hypothetical protein
LDADLLEEKYPSVGCVKRPPGRPFVDYSSHDPEGNIFDIAEPGKKQMVGVFSEAEDKRPRHIKHFMIRAMNPETLAGFYVNVFGFKEEEKALEDPNFYLTDGIVTMVLAPLKSPITSAPNTSARDSITSVSKSKICAASKMTWSYWRNTTLNIWRRSHPMWNPSTT